jgi:serine protease AprX
MRYAITGASVDQVRSTGAADIKQAPSTGIIFATLTEEQASKLRSLGCTVSRVGEVKTAVMPPVAPPVPILAAPRYTIEELAAIAGYEELRNIFAPPLYGAGMNLAIVDTGIRETHQQLRNRVVYSKNFTTDPMRDGFDHGTGVASIAVMVAPECNLLNIKVLDDKGKGTEEELVMAIDHLLELYDSRSEHAPQVINLSLGSPDDGNPANPVRIACREAVKRGIWVVAAAGNSGPAPGTIMTPACERYVFAVGSGRYIPERKTFVISDFSSRGPTLEGLVKPDAVLFGEDLIVASGESDTATTCKSGTSFCSPFGAGMAVIYLEGVKRKALTLEELVEMPPAEMYYVPPQAMEQYLPRICVKPASAPRGKDCDYGYGMPYGPLVMQAVQPRPLLDVGSLAVLMLPLLMIGTVVEAVER